MTVNISCIICYYTYINFLFMHRKMTYSTTVYLIIIYITIVAVADEARLSCSIFIVYRLLTSVTHALL